MLPPWLWFVNVNTHTYFMQLFSNFSGSSVVNFVYYCLWMLARPCSSRPPRSMCRPRLYHCRPPPAHGLTHTRLRKKKLGRWKQRGNRGNGCCLNLWAAATLLLYTSQSTSTCTRHGYSAQLLPLSPCCYWLQLLYTTVTMPSVMQLHAACAEDRHGKRGGQTGATAPIANEKTS